MSFGGTEVLLRPDTLSTCMRFRNHLLARVALVVALVVSESTLAYEVIDTGVPGRNQVFWLDNNRVLFPGFQKGDQPGRLRSVLYVWDFNTKRITVHAEISEGKVVCFSGGYDLPAIG